MSDRHWLEALAELRALHEEKSSTYGDASDPLANFTKLAEHAGQAPERYAVERLIEKAIRALHMIDAGRAQEVAEYPDLASLALCAEALRRNRLRVHDGIATEQAAWDETLMDGMQTVRRCIP